MTPIRPNAFPTPAPQTAAGAGAPDRPDAARAAAQRAFFDAAMGRAAAPAATAAPQAAQFAPQAPAPRPEVRPAATTAEASQKILRPGSLLDIRV